MKFFLCRHIVRLKAMAHSTHVVIMLLVAVMAPPVQSVSIMTKVIRANPTGNPKPMRSVRENLQDIKLTVKNPVKKARISAVVIMAVDWLRVERVV